MPRLTKPFLLVAVLVSGFGFLLLKGARSPQRTGTWINTDAMSAGRSDACAARLEDGRVLVSGGTGEAGALATAEFFRPDGSFSPAPPMMYARSRHGCTTLADGRVLVTGGASNGGAMNAAEVYDPAMNRWFTAGNMIEARAGHTATRLPDGRVLLAGGEGAGVALATLELLDPQSGAFTPVLGTLSKPRQGHAAAALRDGRVLIAGGTDGKTVLATADLYDPATGAVTPAGALLAPRRGFTATTLLDGRVFLAGGTDGSADLASTEIYDPDRGTFAAAGNLAAPRRDHFAFRIPNNNSILLAGGTSAGQPLTAAELFIPWTGEFRPTGTLSAGRARAAGSVMGRGLVMMAGGATNSGGEVYVGPTVMTDKADYSPGEHVIITGTGWQPGETVKLSFVESPLIDTHPDLFAVADAAGNIYNNQFSPDQYDVGITFTLTATGLTSGLTAQTTFTDSPKVGSVTVGSQTGSLTYGTAGSATYAITVNRGSGGGSSGSFTATLSVTTTLPAGATASFSPNPVSFSPTDTSKTATLTINTTASTPAGGPTSFTVKAATSANDFATGDGALTIGKRAITVTADAKSKGYGTADPALTYQVTSGSLAGGDSFTGALSRVAGENVGTYAIQQGTLALNANYTLTYVGANLTITARPITVTADSKTKVYGDADPALTYQVTSGSLVSGDSFTGALNRAAGESVAGSPYAIQQGTLTAGSNYNLTFVGANLTITARPITVTADSKTKVYGNADPALTYQITSGSLAFSDALSGALTRVAGETVAGSPYAIQQGTLTGGGNYTLTFVGASLSITARPVTVTADAKSKVYGNDDPALTYQITTGSLVNGDAFSGALSRAAGENVGTYAIQQGTLALNSNYTLTYVGANLTITARPITVTADAKTKVYGDADPPLTYQITNGSLVNGDAFSGALTRAAGENVGTHAIQQGTLTAGSNYNLSFVGANLTITARPITVTADAKSKVYGDADPALTYQVTSGNLVNGDAFSGALTRAPGQNVGTYAIQQGTLTAGGNYNLTYVGANLTITKRPITVTAVTDTKVYDGTASSSGVPTITAGSLAGTDTGSFTQSFDNKNAGTNKTLTPSGSVADGNSGNNYDVTFVSVNTGTITPRPITVTADAKTKVYGSPDPALTYQVTSGNLVNGDTLSGALTRAAGENVGTYAIQQGTLTAGTNYNLTFVAADLAITPRPITVTADAKTKAYGDPDPSLTYQVTSGSLVNGDAFSGALSRVSGENVGTYAIQQGTLTAGSNYNMTFAGANLTITPRPVTVTADAKSKIYGDADPVLTYQITSGSLVNGDAFSGALTRVAGENVGTYAIQQNTLALNSNYNLTYVGANFTITARPITVTAAAKTKVYGDADPALTYQITSGSLVNGDTLSGALSRVAGENVGAYAIQQGTLTASTNYNLSFIGANLTITARPITVAAEAKTKVYGDPDPALTYQVTSGNLVNGDAFSGALTRAPGENVGVYAIQQGTLTAGSNYNLTYVGANLTITKRLITVTAVTDTKVYDGTANSSGTPMITSGNLVGGDTGSFTQSFDNKNVGTNKTLTPSGSVNDGNGGNNYMVTWVSVSTGTITPRPITVTADAKTKVYGVPDPPLTYQVTSGNLVNGDAFSGALSRAAGEAVGTYAINLGTLTAGSNYALSFVGANLTITKRSTVTTVSFGTNPVGEGAPGSTVIVTVTDTDAAPPTNPAGGTVSITAGSPLVVLGSATCTLAATGPAVAACSVPVQGNDNGSFSIGASYAGDSVHFASAASSPMLAVNNVAPTITGLNVPAAPVQVGTAVTIGILFTDPSPLDTYTGEVTWDDGPTFACSTAASPNNPKTCTAAPRTFSTPGVYGLSAKITDDDGGTNTVEYSGYVVVYDPNGGFVTGGGWINSPPGAYAANPSLTGKANFGFVSKYLKGQSAPSGQTEFDFKAGNLNFHSTAYEWLVISGPKAQYKGSGTINGSGDFGFLLTATDGQVNGGGGTDKLRVKIWDKATSMIVYDNQMGSDDTAALTTALGGGSIQIQSK